MNNDLSIQQWKIILNALYDHQFKYTVGDKVWSDCQEIVSFIHTHHLPVEKPVEK